ncbi:MAG: AAA family ATPase [Deltaproteobacteria bacterium]|nr:AAA family ATPase [Deltaproteobacteria bacterium]
MEGWTGMDIEALLRGLGLEQYIQLFRANDIDSDILPDLSESNLLDMGVASLGHRVKILKAIAALRVRGEPAESPAASPVPARLPPHRTECPAAKAERRQVTVLFCDLVGSTELSSRLDPEDTSALLRTYRGCCAETIARWEGFVAQYLGDGMLAYFGWPQAHEDDAERSVRAGLDLVGAVGRLRCEGTPGLAVRIGIATGEVVAGDLTLEGGVKERSVVGETPNLAARLQSLAAPNAVVIAPETRHLLGRLFDVREIGPLPVKGFAEPVVVHEVQRPRAAESRFEALRAHQTPFVGRGEEIGALLRRWQLAKEGEGQVVLLSGEAGIGKSRISATLMERLADEPRVSLRYYCSPHHSTSPLHPFISQLERAAGFEPDDSPEAKLDKLESWLAPSAKDPAEDMALMAELLSIPTGERYPPLKLSPPQKKERTLAALGAGLEWFARDGTVLVIFEDAHWIDPTSKALLDSIVDRVERLPVLMVITFRPEFGAPWIGLAHVTIHVLSRLSRRDSGLLLERITAGKPLPAEVAEQIIQHTDGVPLFMEELTKTVLESTLLEERPGSYVLRGPLPPLAIPTSLQASLMARLDRLASLKDVAQIGAALGREFSMELLTAVAGRSKAELQEAVDQLIAAGLMFRRGLPPRASLVFKHALVQDAAYASMLRTRRCELHAHIARVLETSFPEVVETQPELLAHHFTQAGLTLNAIEYWHRAGDRAMGRSANLEATRHYTQGIELIKQLAPSPARDGKELRLHLGLGAAVKPVKGYSAPETLQVFSRARELIGSETSLPEQMQTLYGLWGVHLVRSEHEEARVVAAQIVQLVAGSTDPEPHALANRTMGESLWAMGRHVEARRYLEMALEYCGAMPEASTGLRYSWDHRVTALGFLGCVLTSLGYLEQAASAVAEGVAEAERLEHAVTTAMAFTAKSVVAEFRRDAGGLLECADAQTAYCAEHGVALNEYWGRFGQGLARFWTGSPDEGIGLMRTAMAELEGVDSVLFRPMLMGCLAEAWAGVGERERALELLDEAIALADTTEERLFEPELHRLRGQVVLDRHPAEAEACFQRALSVARRQDATFWELRAAVSLARLWRDQGKREQAGDLLAPVYGWFTEGFSTADLVAAKALLDELR